jgi:beta-lactam-binding protein with PASTA domain
MHGSTVFLVAFLTSALTATGTVYVIQRYKVLPSDSPAARAEAVVPSLVGLSETDARANAKTANLSLFVAARESAKDKAGTVLRQSIPSGQRVPAEHPVNVVLSLGLTKVPSVAGVSVADATARLAASGYKLEVSEKVASPTVADGAVIDQTPAADSELEAGGVVKVRVSGGSPEVAAPKLVGLGVQNAQKELEKLGLKPVVRWVSLAETQAFIVLSQKPPAGEKVKAGADVEIVANR